MTSVSRRLAIAIPSLADLRVLPPEVTGTLLRRVQLFWDNFGRPPRRSHILVALSGGPDSVALLAMLLLEASRHSWEIGAAHVNYRLRGDESDGDEDFARRLARSWGLRFHCSHPRRLQSRSHQNLQAWARDTRYQFLERTAHRHGYNRIATGHQLNDRAETVVAAILKAGGTFALSGIPPVRGSVIRPLFEATRAEILTFLRQAGIPYREDSSNRHDAFRRNVIRHHHLPEWERVNPAITEGLARLGGQLWRQRVYLERAAHRLVARAVGSEGKGRLILAASRLARYDEVLDPFVLREFIARLGLELVPRPTTVARFAQLRRQHVHNGTTGVEQGDLIIRRSQDEIAVWSKRALPRLTRMPIRIPRAGQCELTTDDLRIKTDVTVAGGMTSADDRRLAQFDLKSLDGALFLRWAEPGDRYAPLGLGGTKKLMDLLAERGVPSFRRREVPVLTDAAGIVWPIGHPIAARVRVTTSTRRILRVRVIGGQS